MSGTNNQTGHITAIVIVVTALAVVGLVGWRVAAKRHSTTNLKAVNTTQSAKTTPTQAVDTSGLNQDLQGIDGSMTQEGSDSTTATNGLNDAQSEITVPTN